jgi:hypothetical protein
MTSTFAAFCFIFVSTATWASDVPDYKPKPEDTEMHRGPAIVEKASFETGQDGMVQMTLKGTLPTGCHALRLVVPERPDRQRRIEIQAWSVVGKDHMCAQMLQNFSAEVPLKRMRKGIYTIIVNQEELAKVAYR